MDTEHVYVSKADFEAWLQLLSEQGQLFCSHGPDYNSSKIRVFAKLPGTGIEINFDFVAIEQVGTTRLYGRYDAYNLVRVPVYYGEAACLGGKGCRADSVKRRCQEMLNLLTGQDGPAWMH